MTTHSLPDEKFGLGPIEALRKGWILRPDRLSANSFMSCVGGDHRQPIDGAANNTNPVVVKRQQQQ